MVLQLTDYEKNHKLLVNSSTRSGAAENWSKKWGLTKIVRSRKEEKVMN